MEFKWSLSKKNTGRIFEPEKLVKTMLREYISWIGLFTQTSNVLLFIIG